MLYDRVDISEGIDINETSALKECDLELQIQVSTKCL